MEQLLLPLEDVSCESSGYHKPIATRFTDPQPFNILDEIEMNIFILDENIQSAAEQHVDKHVVKMPLELAQLLCTAHRVINPDGPYQDILYKKTHFNHPCAIWVRENSANYEWAFQMFSALANEYHYRYNKHHLSWMKLSGILFNPPKDINVSDTMTPFAQAMPVQYKSDDAVHSYRQYYLGEKHHLFSWKNRDVPSWVRGIKQNAAV